jgi:hypothetical protein
MERLFKGKYALTEEMQLEDAFGHTLNNLTSVNAK